MFLEIGIAVVSGFIAYGIGYSNGQSAPRESGLPPAKPGSFRDRVEKFKAAEIAAKEKAAAGGGDGPGEEEGDFAEALAPFPVKAFLEIDYVDAYGGRTERKVDVFQCEPWSTGGMIMGKCRLRGATRTFRIDRVQACIDLETGEVVDDLRNHLQTRYESTVQYSLNRIGMNHPDFLRVLYYVGKADGQLRKVENEIIAKYFGELSGDSRITAEHVKGLLGTYEVDSPARYRDAIGRLSGQPATIKAAVLSAIREIVGSGKTVAAPEQEALDFATSALSDSPEAGDQPVEA